MFNLRKHYPEFISDDTLHMFCGSCDFGISTDIRPETGAKIVAPYNAIPLPDASVSNVLADPPYADHWANQWHSELPKPKWILKEARRLVKPGGLIAILHIIIIPSYKVFGVTRLAIHPVFCGPNNAVRVLNIFRA